MMSHLCKYCTQRQNELLDAGDGSQLICLHGLYEEEQKYEIASSSTSSFKQEETPNNVVLSPSIDMPTPVDSSTPVDNSTPTSSSTPEVVITSIRAPPHAPKAASGKRRLKHDSRLLGSMKKVLFPSSYDFTTANDDDDEQTREVRLETTRWNKLKKGSIFHIKSVKERNTNGFGGIGMIAILSDEAGVEIQIWLTSLMRMEIKKYKIESGQVFIQYLGEKVASHSQHPYYAFRMMNYKQ